jgi:hypothetical protein
MPNRMETSWDQIPDFVKENARKEPHDDVARGLESRVTAAETDPASVTRGSLEWMQQDADKLPAFGRYENLVVRVHRLMRGLFTHAPEELAPQAEKPEKKAA